MPATRSNRSLSWNPNRPLPEKDASVGSQASVRETYIALGSNIGDRIRHVEDACRELNSAGVQVLRTSALYETQPMYVVDQDPFINGVCEVRALFKAVLMHLVRRLNTGCRSMPKGSHP